MRTVKQLYPRVEAGKMVDAYSAAYHAALYPNAPAYDVTLRELLDAGVLRRSPEFDSRMAGIVNIDQHYEVTPSVTSAPKTRRTRPSDRLFPIWVSSTLGDNFISPVCR